ncbi:MAG: hypothetical protein R2707_16480 [Acidimicrobiales bacterium]
MLDLSEKPEHYRWTITQQILVPRLEGDALEEQDVLLPLGIFDKTRLPDLVAYNDAGQKLPILSGSVRAHIVAQALVLSQLHDAGRLETATGQQIENLVRPMRNLIRKGSIGNSGYIRRRSDESQDRQVLEAISAAIKDLGLDATPSRRFDTSVKNLSKSAYLVVLTSAKPNDYVTLSHSFTDSIEYTGQTSREKEKLQSFFSDRTPSVELEFAKREKLKRRLTGVLFGLPSYAAIRMLRLLSMAPIELSRSAQMADHCGSYYLVCRTPDSLTSNALYWDHNAVGFKKGVHDSPMYDASDEVLAYSSLLLEKKSDAEATFHYQVQIARSSTLTLAAVVSVLLAAIGFAVGRESSIAVDNSAIGLIAGLPAVVLGAVTFSESPFVSRIGRGLRLVAAAVSLFAAAFVVIASMAAVHVDACSDLASAEVVEPNEEIGMAARPECTPDTVDDVEPDESIVWYRSERSVSFVARLMAAVAASGGLLISFVAVVPRPRVEQSGPSIRFSDEKLGLERAYRLGGIATMSLAAVAFFVVLLSSAPIS